MTDETTKARRLLLELRGLRERLHGLESLAQELHEAVLRRRELALRGLIPMCAWCRRIRDSAGDWQQVEDFLRAVSEADVTHGICPHCLQEAGAGLGD